MKKIFTKYFRFCPTTGKFLGIGRLSGLSRLFLPLLGVIAMVWILIRVIPKPSRLNYPCVRAAMPFASGLIGYLAILALSTIAFLKSKRTLVQYPVFFLAAFVVFGISGFYWTNTHTFQLAKNAEVEPNIPIGIAQGIFPGRVVWVHNPRATNENCNGGTLADGWFLMKNNNQGAVDSMISEAIQNLTGQTSDASAWEAIFRFHNNTRGKGAVNYLPGEKIFIKINATSSWSDNIINSDLSKKNNGYVGVSETSPATVHAVLHQLVDVVGVAQTDIYVGDPMKHIYKHLYDYWHADFPNVHYLDNSHSDLGRTKVVAGTTPKIFWADHGTILKDQVWSGPWSSSSGSTPWFRDKLYTIFDSCQYMINIPMMKGHKRAGMTMFAKNHYGSHTAGDASHLHNGLPAPTEMEAGVPRAGYGLFRTQVDIMTSSLLGKKNLVYIMDALWSTNCELGAPLKWDMEPFNGDWTSSVFASLDPVAIESVGYDFLRSEYTVDGEVTAYVQMDGVDDYLHQAADSTNWPAGIKYDPDSSGVHVYSLGTHEHWNNATDKQYSRNLGTGNGIELVTIEGANAIAENNVPNVSYELLANYPNPFNPTTTIAYTLGKKSAVEVTIYNVQGQEVRSYSFSGQPAGYQSVVWDGKNNQGSTLTSGMYVYRVRASSLDDGKTFDKSAKMILLK
jgi:hypothetical protein